MTTKPKARKFRIRRTTGTTGAAQRVGAEETQQQAVAGGMAGDVASAREGAVDAEINAIRREGLTGRQLRMARRLAQKHNLPATSDFDAVRLLRKAGIDPFQRTNMLELVVPGKDRDKDEAPSDKVQLPQTVPAEGVNLPSTEMNPLQARMREIGEIQKDIARRRRRKMALLFTRLAFFVLLPTLIVGWYFANVATPMYSSKSEFLILKADNAGGGGLGSLLSGTQFATNQDSIAVQSYLQSKDAMLRLDRDVGFMAHFQQPWIDPIQRLAPDATIEDAYKIYKKNVKIGYDPTEGVIRMEVTAADPEVAAEFSRKLISYAEERVNVLSEKKRDDQMKDALEAFEKAEAERRKAQQALVELQQKGAILDPEGVIASLRSQINNIEVQLQDKQLQLAALQDNARPNKAKVEGVKGDIRRLEALLRQLNAKMINASKGENSLAELSVRIQMAQADLATRDMMLQSALQQLEQTRAEANRQVRYLTTSVNPVASQSPSYPRVFEDTLLAFLIFSGIYLMVSLTASILREQISS
ncbi:capsule biosynthesis protein [Jhaorihella thermophila]|uniref:Capsular polysaccharide transport system permease protein n=1 Tax=Jhaorihella thermophila TaxID=488547 RepID=A0A1H5X165_9RHOB|nr:capsule biosynthesis protein [Jhaorihella thermophila]SEG04986.1 capsular polysaccharide transport system permease protein [Jhaorihella thermophila]